MGVEYRRTTRQNGHPKGDAISRDVKISRSLGMDLDLKMTGFHKQVKEILNNFYYRYHFDYYYYLLGGSRTKA